MMRGKPAASSYPSWVKTTHWHALQEQGSVLPAEVQAATGRTYEVGRVAIRTLWFDTQLLAALDPARQPQPLLAQLQTMGSGYSSNGSSSGVQLRLTANATPRQVVMLGAGMDTRAWRLHLPPGDCAARRING
jgi:O-methyltransferase involved in polyketide biosynthesis